MSPVCRGQFNPAGGTPHFEMRFIGASGVTYVVEVSSDLVTWITLTTLTGSTNAVPVVDPNALGVGQRFYRVSLAP